MLGFLHKPRLPEPGAALPGRDTPMQIPAAHAVHGRPLAGPFPPGLRQVQFGLGCFWGAERRFWSLPGVYTTAVGYAGGQTPHPTYEEVCSGRTGHTETVLVVYDPKAIGLPQLLATFWESHDPTQGMRQGNDVGTQYRSAIYLEDDAELATAEQSRQVFEAALTARGLGPVTTEIAPAGPFYYAEAYHQQYLEKNPGGYCGLGGTGVRYPAARAAGR